MKKFGYIIAALATLAIAAPSIASAETVVIKRGGGHHERDGYRERSHRADKIVIKRGGYREGARAEYRGRDRDHGWHRGHDKKVVIIKHGRDRRD